MSNYNNLPKNLPIPKDDGACNHLMGIKIPNIVLLNQKNQEKNLYSYQKKTQVFYFYPMTGKPNIPLPIGWDAIAGARGCTPQALSFQKKQKELHILNAEAIGVSSQNPQDLAELSTRLELKQELLSDQNLKLTNLLSLPTFKIEEVIYIKRLTLIAQKGIIVKCFYPIFPSDKNIFEVLNWLQKSI